jgi:hypothetical protein
MMVSSLRGEGPPCFELLKNIMEIPRFLPQNDGKNASFSELQLKS